MVAARCAYVDEVGRASTDRTRMVEAADRITSSGRAKSEVPSKIWEQRLPSATASERCHPEERSSSCHAEERSDEGSAGPPFHRYPEPSASRSRRVSTSTGIGSSTSTYATRSG